MKALSIRQPWAWLIAEGHKDVENRTWRTDYRGPILIHASQYDRGTEYWLLSNMIQASHNIEIPAWGDVQRGGIIAVADLVAVVTKSPSRWFEGPYGFFLANIRRGPFIPFSGSLKLFEVPDDLALVYSCESLIDKRTPEVLL